MVKEKHKKQKTEKPISVLPVKKKKPAIDKRLERELYNVSKNGEKE